MESQSSEHRTETESYLRDSDTCPTEPGVKGRSSRGRATTEAREDNENLHPGCMPGKSELLVDLRSVSKAELQSCQQKYRKKLFQPQGLSETQTH